MERVSKEGSGSTRREERPETREARELVLRTIDKAWKSKIRRTPLFQRQDDPEEFRVGDQSVSREVGLEAERLTKEMLNGLYKVDWTNPTIAISDIGLDPQRGIIKRTLFSYTTNIPKILIEQELIGPYADYGVYTVLNIWMRRLSPQEQLVRALTGVFRGRRPPTPETSKW